MKRSLMTNEEWRLSKAEKLASKFGIKVVGTEFAVCCPGIDDPFEKMGIKLSWASAEPGTIEVNLFIEFMKALIAVDYAVLFVEVSEDHHNVDNIHHGMFKDLYTNLSVYGRAMFFDIVEQMFCPRKPIIFRALAHYPDEGLDFSDLYHDQGKTTVGDIYKAYVAPTVDPWVEQRAYPAKRVAELKKELGEDFNEKFEALKQVNFNVIQGNDNGENRDDLDSPQAVELVANEAFPITDH